jgi:hypothetical protein
LNKYDFTNLVKDPKKLGEADIEKLKSVVAEFPYFSVGQNLLVKALHNTKHYEYDKFLKQASLQAGNRSVLYNLVHNLPQETEIEINLNQSVEGIEFENPIYQKEEIAEPIIPVVETPIIPEVKEEAITPEIFEKVIPEEESIPEVFETSFKEELVQPIETSLTKIEIPEEDSIPEVFENSFKELELPEVETAAIFELPKTETKENIPAEPIKPETIWDPNIITEEEKLVNATGKFVKFVPRKNTIGENLDDVSLIPEILDPVEGFLADFDMSTLSGSEEKSNLAANDSYKPVYLEVEKLEETPIEETLNLVQTELEKPEETQQLHEEIRVEPIAIEPVIIHQTIQEEASKIEETVKPIVEENISKPEIETQALGDDFFKWIQAKEEKEIEENTGLNLVQDISVEPTIEPKPVEEIKAKIVEDDVFVNKYQEDLAKQADNALKAVIETHHASQEIATPIVQANIVIEETVAPSTQIEEVISKAIISETETALPVVEKKTIEVNIAEEKTIEEKPKPIETKDEKREKMLQSLYSYEVNEFLAPLYEQVSYQSSLFEISFQGIFEGKNSVEPEWTEPFVALKPKEIPKPEPIEKAFKFEPISEEPVAPIEKPAEVAPVIKKTIEPEVQKPITRKVEEPIKPKLSDIPTPKIQRDSSSVESILDKFIRENPSIARPKSEFYSPTNMARLSAEEDEEIISETLAQIYTRQGLYKKAIGMYEKLGLHYPEKIPYFAGLISQIKSAHNID